MTSPPRRISWISPPPEICVLCKEPLGPPEETSSWNGRPAHRDCVRVHLMQRDPAFAETTTTEEGTEESEDGVDDLFPRDDDDAEFD